MLNTEEYKILIDSYHKGNLSVSESAQLEKEALENPALHNEMVLQKTIVSTLQATRKAELKARLEGIEIKGGLASNTWKYAAVACAVFFSGLATYYFTTKTSLEQLEVTTITAPLSESEPLTDATAKLPISAEKVAQEESLSETTNQSASTVSKVNSTKESASNKSIEEVPHLPELNAPDAISHGPLNKEIENPEHGMGKTSLSHTSVSGVEVVKSKKHKFHYRYFDNKLFLYGDFEAKTYEILELNTSNGQELYLKFENKYYDLEPNKTEISKLEIVKSSETLKQLEEVQK